MRFGFTKEDGTPVVMLGLTDLNLRRMQREGDPVRALGHEFAPPDGALLAAAEIVVFHATRQACVEIARVTGIDEKTLLDVLGEG